jgi:hypothetical protein
MALLEVEPTQTLSTAQWQRLWDLYFGAMIIQRFEATMVVLKRKGLAKRRELHNRWELTDAGREALKTAPIAYRIP